MKEQNIYDNEEFFKGYQNLRSQESKTANDLIESPQLFELIGDLKNKKVLDLGCGTGVNTKKIATLGAKEVLGIDLSTKMIKVANQENKLDNIEYKVMSMSDINEIKEKFDLIVSSLAIHYVKDYDKLCKNIFNLLEDGGEFIFSQGHPMDSAIIIDKTLNHYVSINNKKYYLLSDYNNEGQRVSHWFVDNVITYHRNVSHLVNGLINAGFTLEKMIESYANENIINKNPEFSDQLDHSYFIYFKAKK